MSHDEESTSSVASTMQSTNICKHTIVNTMLDMDLKANGNPESIYLWGKLCFPKDIEQQRAFQILAAKFVLTFCIDVDENDTFLNYCSHVTDCQYRTFKETLQEMVGLTFADKQLIMLLTGPTNSGKSKVIAEFLTYAKEYCLNIDYEFTNETILITACTGFTAASIGGKTLCSAIHYHKHIECISAEEKLNFRNNVRMMVVDDFNMLSKFEIERIDRRIQSLKNNRNDPFGGIDMIFLGDLRQLPPVGRTSVYNTNFAGFLYCINVFVELGNIYGSQDAELSQICSRFYNGCPTENDFVAINKRLISLKNPLPQEATTICPSNVQKEVENYENWLMYLRQQRDNEGIVIIADKFQLFPHEDIKPKPSPTYFFSPRLFCYPRCPQLLTLNLDTNNNLTSGTRGYFLDVVLKPQFDFTYQVVNGIRVRCVYASQIEHVLWETRDNTIEIKPQQCLLSFNNEDALFPTTQVPLISNSAAVLSQKQDLSSDMLYVPSWKYGQNWPYVLLSRARSLKNIFLGEPLDIFADYSIPKRLNTMLRKLRLRASPGEFSPDAFFGNKPGFDVID